MCLDNNGCALTWRWAISFSAKVEKKADVAGGTTSARRLLLVRHSSARLANISEQSFIACAAFRADGSRVIAKCLRGAPGLVMDLIARFSIVFVLSLKN